MPVPPPQPPVEILALAALATWPDPLPELLAQRLIHLHTTADLYQAAAMLKDQGRFLALLVDPEHLSRRELRMLMTVRRHVALPIWSLPTRHHKTLINELGIVPWEVVCRTLSGCALGRITPQGTRYDTQKHLGAFSHPPTLKPPSPPPEIPSAPPLPKAHNPPENTLEKRAEIPVASHLADSYDEFNATPILTELELRMLLGHTE